MTTDTLHEASAKNKRLEMILALFRRVGELNASIDFEPSFKATHGRLFENRFLLGINRQAAESCPDERIVSICEGIGMPQNLLASFRQYIADANHVYFGVERDEQTLIFKAYLEYRDKIEQQIGNAPVSGQCFPLFTGFKWDTASPGRQAVTRYEWYPSLPVPGVLERVSMIIEPSLHGELFEMVKAVAERASERIAGSDIQYLEVTEEANLRKSFDMNVYKSALRLEDCYPHLLSVMRHYAIPFDRFDPLYQRIKGEKLGHLAGGVDRKNKDFVTIYYGARPVHSSQLGSARIIAGDGPPRTVDEAS